MFCTFWLRNVLRATAACNFSTSHRQKVVRTRQFFNILTSKCASRHSRVAFFGTSELPKWLRPCGVLCILTCKCASRHSGVQFLNIATSKMAPPMWCFVHFDLQMCFAPQRRAIFEHRNFQNGSAHVVFCAFWLANVLFATAACHFSPVRGTATSAPAALASLLFEHQGPRFIEKTQRFATSLTFFAHVELLASDSTRMLIFLLVTWLMLIFLLLTWLLCDSAFQLYILSEVRLLNFLRWYYDTYYT